MLTRWMWFIHIVNHFILRVLGHLWLQWLRCVGYNVIYTPGTWWGTIQTSIHTRHLHSIPRFSSLQHRSRSSCNLHHQRLNAIFNKQIQQHWTPKQLQHLIIMEGWLELKWEMKWEKVIMKIMKKEWDKLGSFL